MPGWFLILVVCVIFIILMIVNFYILVHFSHPDDKNTAYFPRFLIIFSLLLMEASVLLIPLDVANGTNTLACQQGWSSESSCGNLNMGLFWQIIYWCIASLILVIIPFAIFLYEADDALVQSKIQPYCEATKYTFACMVICSLIIGLLYFFLNNTKIPISSYSPGENTNAWVVYNSGNTGTLWDEDSFPPPISTAERNLAAIVTATKVEEDLNFKVSVTVYLVGLLSFVGWFLFSIFGGIGFSSLPADLINGYINRPQPLTNAELAVKQKNLSDRVVDLIEVGKLLKEERQNRRAKGENFFSRARNNQADRNTLTKFKQMVYLLEEDYGKFKDCKTYSDYNPLVPVFQLGLGILSLIISLLWFLHIVLYMFMDPYKSTFLNEYFIWFDNNFLSLFGTISLAIFSMYLYFCVVAGLFKFGVRFIWIPMHPMKVNETYMSSFLFNIIVLLICTLPIVEFSTKAFAEYALFTSSYQFFGIQIQYLSFFAWFNSNNIFVYIIVCIGGLSGLYFTFRSKDKPADSEDIRKAISGDRKKQLKHR